MTGAPIPAGADSVVRVEDTDAGTSEVTIRDDRDVTRNIRQRGEDVRAGTVVMRDGTLPNARGALLADAIGTVAGAMLGTSTVTAYIESGAGVSAGGRTGLASLVTAALFLVALLGRR